MFVWPTVNRALTKPKEAPLFPEFTNHLVTTEFWVTFPSIAVAIPFLFICGFVTVYFLGQKGFCTYACPYGGFFALADKVAPGKIRVTDACNECGHCTATCTSNVLVHAEVKEFGMVVDPGCMKCMDCISVCPNDALYFGFGKPTIATKKPTAKKAYSLTWPEEGLAAVVFAASLWAVWDVYQLVPMLMALGIASVTAFLFLRTIKLLRSKDLSFYRYSLKTSGKFRTAGWVFASFALLWVGVNAHSGFIRYHERAGAIDFESLQIPDELALAQPDPSQWLSAKDKENIADGTIHFRTAADAGFFLNKPAISKLAWLEYLSGDTEPAIQLLANAAGHQEGQAKALSLYYRGAILNRLGRNDEALASLNQALVERPDLVTALEEKGEALWQLGRKEDAVAAWSEAVRDRPELPLANSFLAAAAASADDRDAANAHDLAAENSTPQDASFYYMLGMRLENIGMNGLAERKFARATQLDPKFKGRRNLDLMKRLGTPQSP